MPVKRKTKQKSKAKPKSRTSRKTKPTNKKTTRTRKTTKKDLEQLKKLKDLLSSEKPKKKSQPYDVLGTARLLEKLMNEMLPYSNDALIEAYKRQPAVREKVDQYVRMNDESGLKQFILDYNKNQYDTLEALYKKLKSHSIKKEDNEDENMFNAKNTEHKNKLKHVESMLKKMPRRGIDVSELQNDILDIGNYESNLKKNEIYRELEKQKKEIDKKTEDYKKNIDKDMDQYKKKTSEEKDTLQKQIRDLQKSTKDEINKASFELATNAINNGNTKKSRIFKNNFTDELLNNIKQGRGYGLNSVSPNFFSDKYLKKGANMDEVRMIREAILQNKNITNPKIKKIRQQKDEITEMSKHDSVTLQEPLKSESKQEPTHAEQVNEPTTHAEQVNEPIHAEQVNEPMTSMEVEENKGGCFICGRHRLMLAAGLLGSDPRTWTPKYVDAPYMPTPSNMGGFYVDDLKPYLTRKGGPTQQNQIHLSKMKKEVSFKKLLKEPVLGGKSSRNAPVDKAKTQKMGTVKQGLDGNNYVIKKRSNGVKYWALKKEQTTNRCKNILSIHDI